MNGVEDIIALFLLSGSHDGCEGQNVSLGLFVCYCSCMILFSRRPYSESGSHNYIVVIKFSSLVEHSFVSKV